ncbi:MAG TPA: ATP-binding protein [Burkholderiaceae bacterium]|nr:ATP-binding protein [Burkholderiaceae bacterium]
MKKQASLQTRLLVLVLGAAAAVWIATAAWTWFDVRHEVDELLDSHLAQAAALLIAQQSHPQDDDVDREVAPLHRYARRVSFQVWHRGALALRSANAPADGPMAPSSQGFQEVMLHGERWRVFATEGRERDVRVYVGERADARDHILRAVTRGVLGPLFIALPLLGGLVAWAVWGGLDPLRKLSALLARRSPQALDAVSLSSPGRELQALVDALNTLLGRIANLLQAERRFTSDAAHELRTPLAALKAQAQVALAAEDDASRRHALRCTLEACDRASHLVDQLLLLSRVENQIEGTTVATDLTILSRKVLADLAPYAIDKRQTLELDAPPRCPVSGNETLLGALLRNLVDNALRYSPPGARIHVRVDGDSITVDDTGPGIDAASRARLGERFFRVAGTGEIGSGLGWSIVRRIADAHRLVVRAEPSPLGGLRVVVDGFDPHGLQESSS